MIKMNSVYQQSKRKTSSEGASPSLFMWKMCPQKLLKDSDSVEKIRNFDSLLGQNGRSKKLANNYLRLLMCDQPDIAEVLFLLLTREFRPLCNLMDHAYSPPGT